MTKVILITLQENGTSNNKHNNKSLYQAILDVPMISKTVVTISMKLPPILNRTRENDLVRFIIQENSFWYVKTNTALKMLLVINRKMIKLFSRYVGLMLMRTR